MQLWKPALVVFFMLMTMMALFLIGFSVRLVDVRDHALKVNKNTMQIYTNKLYDGGRYFAGIGYDYLRFPRAQQMIIYSDSVRAHKIDRAKARFYEDATFLNTIQARTSEGIKVSIDLAIFYKLGTTEAAGQKALQLYDIFSKFGHNYDSAVQKLTLMSVQDIASRYTAINFINQRDVIETLMESTLRDAVNNISISLSSFEVLNLAFPQAFQDAVEQTQVIAVKVDTTTSYAETIAVAQTTALKVAEIDAQIWESNERSKADIYNSTQSAIATSIAGATAAKKEGLEALKTGFTITNSAFYVNYMWIYTHLYRETPNFNLGIQTPSALKLETA